MITVPVIVHTRSLLIEITRVDAPAWVVEVYAIFFAIAFDCSIFMFALFKKREQAVVFAVISGIVGWLFWCSDLVFIDMQQDGTSGQEWARLVMGTVWAGFSAYLVFWCSEIVAESFDQIQIPVRKKEKKKNIINGVPTGRPMMETGTPIIHDGLNGSPKKKAKKSEAIRLQGQGLSIAQIAEQLGVTDRSVRRYLE